MIRHLFTILWKQRGQNGWLFAELLLVFIALWLMCDQFIAHLYTYYRPLGYNVENCWRLSFEKYPPTVAEYVSDTTQQLSEGEALMEIIERMQRMPEVDGVCQAFYSSPYSYGNSWMPLVPCSADSTRFKENSYHRYNASYDYFDVFRIKDKDGGDFQVIEHPERYKGIIITVELERDFFGSVAGKGRTVCLPNGTEQIQVVGVSQSIRHDDFKKPEAAFFQLLSPDEIRELTNYYGVNTLEVTVRMKETMTPDEMNDFLLSKGDQLSVSNLYVSGAYLWSNQRDNILSDRFQQMSVFILIGLFTLINVFFGITGIFWLRVEQRRSEIGLRMAMGSTHRSIGWFFTAEGWLLLVSVIPLALIIIFNLCYMELPDTGQMDMGWWRFGLGFLVAFFLMATMIILGTWIPARRAMKLQPAEALHYE